MKRKVHELKTHPEPFHALNQRRKTAEFRKDDRGFRVGHVLKLVYFDPLLGENPEMIVWRRVTHIARGPLFGIPDSHVMMSLAVMKAAEIRAVNVPVERRRIKSVRGTSENVEMRCGRCREWWPAQCFRVDRSRLRGRQSTCKACLSEGGAK